MLLLGASKNGVWRGLLHQPHSVRWQVSSLDLCSLRLSGHGSTGQAFGVAFLLILAIVVIPKTPAESE
jgi:hypothetical protein